MNGKYLVVNGGSSSLKFSIFDMPAEKLVGSGNIERLRTPESYIKLKIVDENGKETKITKEVCALTTAEGIDVMLKEAVSNGFISSIDDIVAVGHRIVHGGNLYNKSTPIDGDVINNLKGIIPLAPTHLPVAIDILDVMMESENLSSLPHVGVFDTSFHQTIPEVNYTIPVPNSLAKKHNIRKYGFHGTSYRFINDLMQEYFDSKSPNLIICHLGSGSSICAIKEGKSFDTTMGMTPNSGLTMAKRIGDTEIGLLKYIMEQEGITLEEALDILEKNSGLYGITGLDYFPDIVSAKNNGEKQATIAYERFILNIIKVIMGYYLELDCNVDSIIFTAGIGENNAAMIREIIDQLSKIMGLSQDGQLKGISDNITEISSGCSKIPVLVIGTNEELMIAKDTYEIVNGLDIKQATGKSQ